MNRQASSWLWVVLLAGVGVVGCGDSDDGEGPGTEIVDLRGGTDGGTAQGTLGGELGEVTIVVPPGAAASATLLRISPTHDDTPLPERAFAVGPHVRLDVVEGDLTGPAQLTIPFDDDEVTSYGETAMGVKVWRIARAGDAWELVEPVSIQSSSVTIEIDVATTVGAGVKLAEE